MNNSLTIARRELRHTFSTPIGWIALCAFLLITGFFFVLEVRWYAMESMDSAFNPMREPMDLGAHLVAPFFGEVSLLLLMICPALTMRSFAEDRRQRSLELLLTSPLSTTEIVLGKYLGALAFAGVLVLCTAHYPLLLLWIGRPDPGVILSSYLSLFLLVGAFLAVGLLASAMTESQVIALVVTLVALLGFWVLAAVGMIGDGPVTDAIADASLFSHAEKLGEGILRLRDLVYFASFVGVFLFATHQRVESLRWG
jgi:ABC-2 type transport system permease protein